ncbi:MAG: choice-of-anchor X domain-containing protein [Candidatus Thermoplasmatota archaeon]|nr:choice-of-anchor X domain-containing protein [Candidatus Thermoplasmatota archaeon]
MPRARQALVILATLLISSQASLVLAEEEEHTTCTVLVDWDVEEHWDGGWNLSYDVLHRYLVVFNPPFTGGDTPTSVTVSVEQNRDDVQIADDSNASFVSAGGEIDIILDTEPKFGDTVQISVTTAQASCSRELGITHWNQPMADHEITRETTWNMEGTEQGDSIDFEGRGWQKRTGDILESNELGNGTLMLDSMNGTQGLILALNLETIWLNETYEGVELLRQDFEMRGNGSLFLNTTEEDADGSDGFSVDVDVHEVFVLRSWEEGRSTERFLIDGTGWLSFNGGDNNSSGGGFGQLSSFYWETWDEDDRRRLQNLQLEANATLRLDGGSDDYFSFNLDEFRILERWEDGIREEQHSLILGGGEFGFLIDDDFFEVEVNGTIPVIHFESQGGETIAETIRLDGDYDGDAEGSFGLIRRIVDSGTQQNATGSMFEVDKIENEFWFNVSATPIGPISEEWEAEHNLTYEYTVPQIDWWNRTIRYQYIEDNGTTDNEYPESSPIIRQPQRPDADRIFENHISRETGSAPKILVPGDSFALVGNDALILSVDVMSVVDGVMDGHNITLAEWIGDYGGDAHASGSVVNEGPLAGLLNEIYRWIEISFSENGTAENLAFIEHQSVDRVLSPSVITEEENTPPALLSVGFREGRLLTEGDSAHLEVLVYDFDTDVTAVSVDLTEMGLGIIELSDSGLLGDHTIHDDIWTALVTYEGLLHGTIESPVTINDFWISMVEEASLEITNAAPRMMSLQFYPASVIRGDTVDITVTAVDGHGVVSAAVDLLGVGGELSQLVETDGEWVGQFTVPDGMSPGERAIPIRITDGDGETVIAEHTHADGFPVDAPRLSIENEAPSIGNLTIIRDGETVNTVHVPSSGDPITHLLEVYIEDPDGVSSAQVRIGRLAPIGSSEAWLLMVDDGTGGDRVAGDDVYSLLFDARSTLPGGNMTIEVRATDTYLSTTPFSEQQQIIELEKLSSGGSGGSWISDNSMIIIALGLVLLLITGVTAVVISMRNSDTEW